MKLDSAPPGLMVAFDFDTLEGAKQLAEELKGLRLIAKIGLELFTASGRLAVEWFKENGFPVFLDLKFHDIPNTVSRAVRRCVEMEVDFVTVHLAGGMEMLVRAQDEASKSRTKILGVSVLTSLGDGDQVDTGCLSVADTLRLRTALAKRAGIFGMVCAGADLPAVQKEGRGALKWIVPGIRLEQKSDDDQKRTLSPAEALSLGADWLVVGRPIYQDREPRVQVERILATLKERGTG